MIMQMLQKFLKISSFMKIINSEQWENTKCAERKKRSSFPKE